MVRYMFRLGDAVSSLKFIVHADSPEGAVLAARQEFEKYRKTLNEGPTKQTAKVLAEKLGIDPSFLDHYGRCEFGVEMASARFQLLCVQVDPHLITVRNIVAAYPNSSD